MRLIWCLFVEIDKMRKHLARKACELSKQYIIRRFYRLGPFILRPLAEIALLPTLTIQIPGNCCLWLLGAFLYLLLCLVQPSYSQAT